MRSYEAWKELAEHSLKGMFIARAEGIKSGSFTATETDEFIAEYSKELMDKYENMTVDEIREEMLFMVLKNRLNIMKGER
jgi:hypothetical protein